MERIPYEIFYMIFDKVSVPHVNLFGCADKYCQKLVSKYFHKSESSLTNMIYETSLLHQRRVFIQTKQPDTRRDIAEAAMRLKGTVTIISRHNFIDNYANVFEEMGLQTNICETGIRNFRERKRAMQDLIDTSDVIFHERYTDLCVRKSRINVIRSTYSRFNYDNFKFINKKYDVTKSDYIIVDNLYNNKIIHLTDYEKTKVIYVLNEFKSNSLVHYFKTPKKNYRFIKRNAVDSHIYNHHRVLSVQVTPHLGQWFSTKTYGYRKNLSIRISGIIYCLKKEFKSMDSFPNYTAILFNLEDIKLAKRARRIDPRIEIFIVKN